MGDDNLTFFAIGISINLGFILGVATAAISGIEPKRNAPTGLDNLPSCDDRDIEWDSEGGFKIVKRAAE